MMAHLDPALHCLNTRLEKIEDVQRRISKYYTTCEHQLKEVSVTGGVQLVSEVTDQRSDKT